MAYRSKRITQSSPSGANGTKDYRSPDSNAFTHVYPNVLSLSSSFSLSCPILPFLLSYLFIYLHIYLFRHPSLLVMFFLENTE